jgi:hypothetical protein
MSGAYGRPMRGCGCDVAASASSRAGARALRTVAASASWQHGPSQQQQHHHHHHHSHPQQQQPAGPAPAYLDHIRARRRAPGPASATFAAGAGDDGLLGRSPEFVEEASGWRRRWTVVMLCFVAFMLCNMDRVNMSVAILPMQQQYAWDSKTVGLVQSSFFWCGRNPARCGGGGVFAGAAGGSLGPVSPLAVSEPHAVVTCALGGRGRGRGVCAALFCTCTAACAPELFNQRVAQRQHHPASAEQPPTRPKTPGVTC